VNKVFGFRQIGFIKSLTVLVEYGAIGLPKEDVLLGVTDREFDFNLFVEIVGGIFGFPETVIQTVIVEQRAVGFGIGLALAFNGIFRNQLPIELTGAMFEQFLKS